VNYYRIEDKENVLMNGERTSFRLYKRAVGCYVFAGQYYAPGWDQSDDECIAWAVEQLFEGDDE
jgi:hypothetical protein